MKLSEIVVADAVVPQLTAVERDEAIGELVDRLVSAGVVAEQDRDEIMREILQRETRSSTGFGKGVAVPHVKHKSITRIASAVGVSPAGIEFNSLDRQPVYSVFLLLSPEDRPDEHLQAMEAIFKNLTKDSFRRALRESSTADELQSVLAGVDDPERPMA